MKTEKIQHIDDKPKPLWLHGVKTKKIQILEDNSKIFVVADSKTKKIQLYLKRRQYKTSVVARCETLKI